MADLYHFMGGDLSLNAGGDLLTASGQDEVTQRLLRRLLTNTGDYIWQLSFGAGLPQQVGKTTDLTAVQSAIRSQIFADAGVAKFPEPVVTLTSQPNGTYIANITYTDASTGQSVPLSVPLG
ncbi:MAG: phage tail protein [Betaproteobacteria bacterium]|nr:phage tail protein [Betaproteobacteria bacterium]